MAADPELLGSLERALAANPSERSLRVHLATLLLEDRQFGRALDCCDAGLHLDADDDELLRLRAAALDGLGLGLGSTVDPEVPSADELYELTRPAVTLDSVA